MDLAASQEGLFVAPEAGAAVIATRKLRESSFLSADDEVVIFSTGSGLMHTDLISLDGLPVLNPNDADAVAGLG
jgi:threonine synthase